MFWTNQIVVFLDKAIPTCVLVVTNTWTCQVRLDDVMSTTLYEAYGKCLRVWFDWRIGIEIEKIMKYLNTATGIDCLSLGNAACNVIQCWHHVCSSHGQQIFYVDLCRFARGLVGLRVEMSRWLPERDNLAAQLNCSDNTVTACVDRLKHNLVCSQNRFHSPHTLCF